MERPGATWVIASPPCTARLSGRPWQAALQALGEWAADLEVRMTATPGEATRLAEKAAAAGAVHIVAAGGDGTIGEVVEGLMRMRPEQRPPLGILPLGRGNDFARELSLPLDAGRAVGRLAAARPRSVDVGAVRCTALGGGSNRHLHFINMACVGFAAAVSRSVAAYGRSVTGTWPYVRGLIANLACWRNRPAVVAVDGTVRQALLFSLNIANGRYYGGGMVAAPDARIDDGLLDVTLMDDLSTMDVIHYMPNNYSGRFEGIGNVIMTRGTRITVQAEHPLLVQLDGDVVGTTPATFEIVPGAVRLLA